MKLFLADCLSLRCSLLLDKVSRHMGAHISRGCRKPVGSEGGLQPTADGKLALSPAATRK